MGLKTLKDFEYHWKCEFDDTLVKENDLRKEAIKWIKRMKNELHVDEYNEEQDYQKVTCYFHEGNTGYSWMNGVGWECEKCEGNIDWIKHFFNITKEDLK